MKKNYELLTTAVLILIGIASCKNDPEPLPLEEVKETVLSKVFVDGKLEQEFLYNADKQLAQIDVYNLTTGVISFSTQFEYDNSGLLQKEISLNAEGKPTSHKQYTKNADGEFVSSQFKVLTGADSGKVTILNKFFYNEAGLLNKESWHDPETEEEESYRTYLYYPNGNLERSEYYWGANLETEKTYEVRYSPAGNALPESISRRRGYPVHFTLYMLVAEKIESENFDTPVSTPYESHQVISDRVFNEEGLVTKQTVTHKHILPEKPDEVVEMMYEYIEI